MKVYCNKEILLDNAEVADRFSTRLVGLLNRKSLAPSEGLFLYRCGRVHSLFMRFPIDVIYFSDDMRVLDVETLLPWRLGKRVSQAKHVLELSAGMAAGKISTGDSFIFDSLPYLFH
jgi:uncharacterized membrane protein (UPF0127 family)